MMFKKMRKSMAFNIIGVIICILVIFGGVISIIGYANFTVAFKEEYSTTTYHMARTATSLVDADDIDDFLNNKKQEDYQRAKKYLDGYCDKMHVSLAYVIKVDTSDYKRFVSVLNSVNNSVDNTEYVEWETGYRRDTTNDEYRRKYMALYNKESDYETIYRTNLPAGQHPHITAMVPVKNSDGEVKALMCIQRPIRELKDAQKPYRINVLISTPLACIAAAVFIALFLKRQVVIPVRKVSDEAARFARENTAGEKIGEISRFDEISRLAHSVDKMEVDMLSYIENLTAVTAERERISAELSIASTIQENSIPNDFPAFPDRPEFDIYASMTPAKEVGGDFYNFFLIDDDRLGIVIADVSGKGVPAALFMMVTNILIREITMTENSPAEVLSKVNQKLCQHNKADMFATVWLGILEISTGKLIMANAGHNYPVLCRKNGSFELIKSKHSLAVGAMEGIAYSNSELRMNKGDKLFVYTDGLTEASDKSFNMFGEERMLSALNSVKGENPEKILEGVKADVDEFVGDAPQFDDLTMVCIELIDEKDTKQ